VSDKESFVTDTHDPDAIVRRVLGRYLHNEALAVRAGSTRCTLVVDATADALALALSDTNFQLVLNGSALAGHEGRRSTLSHRILITRQTPDFLSDAPVLDYGIIGLDALADVDAAETYAENATAKMISVAIAERRLVSQRGAWVLMLKPDGEHVFVSLE